MTGRRMRPFPNPCIYPEMCSYLRFALGLNFGRFFAKTILESIVKFAPGFAHPLKRSETTPQISSNKAEAYARRVLEDECFSFGKVPCPLSIVGKGVIPNVGFCQCKKGQNRRDQKGNSLDILTERTPVAVPQKQQMLRMGINYQRYHAPMSTMTMVVQEWTFSVCYDFTDLQGMRVPHRRKFTTVLGSPLKTL